MATANSQQQLEADQDLLADKWTEVLVAEEYKLERPSKSYPRCRLLPRHEGAPLCETTNITPDTVKVNPVGPDTGGKTHL